MTGASRNIGPNGARRVFGYGSLVNRQTTGAQGELAVLPGWERVWVSAHPGSTGRADGWRYAFLSIQPGAQEIGGLISPVADWDALRLREAAYDPVADPALPEDVVTWVASAPRPAGAKTPILLSYLDTVLQGFAAEFGPEGPESFMDSTAGWSVVEDDRAAPIYPRATALTQAERDRTDALLRASAVPVIRRAD